VMQNRAAIRGADVCPKKKRTGRKALLKALGSPEHRLMLQRKRTSVGESTRSLPFGPDLLRVCARGDGIRRVSASDAKSEGHQRARSTTSHESHES